MVDLAQIRQVPVVERLHIIELILQSLKQDMSGNLMQDKSATTPKPFRVRQFDLGKDIHVDRDMIYAERGL